MLVKVFVNAHRLFSGNAREHGLASRMLGNNRQVIRKNLFSQQRKHQNNVYINNDDNVSVCIFVLL